MHYVVFFVLPAWHCTAQDCAAGAPAPTSGSGGHARPTVCHRSGGLMIFYLLCCLYLLLSAKQLRCGYPLIILEHPLTDSSSLMALYIHQLFMALPFLWETRVVIDWTFTPDTSLSLTMGVSVLLSKLIRSLTTVSNSEALDAV